MRVPDPPRPINVRDTRTQDLVDARNQLLEFAAIWLGVEFAESRGDDASLQRVNLSAKARQLMLEEWT